LPKRRIKAEFENGHECYRLRGEKLVLRENPLAIPSIESVTYHTELSQLTADSFFTSVYHGADPYRPLLELALASPFPIEVQFAERKMITDYHAKYFAYELTKRCPSDSLEKLAGAVASAQVDLNPHQVDAALFAFHSPLSKGALLADEVGLGKTIEAGLVISQRWAERKRRILIITPSNLRKQWHQELSEKFFLPCTILEARFYNAAIKQGRFRPFEVQDEIIICSYQFARNKASDVANTPWDLVVIDEAHRLRNVYKPSNVIANTLKGALGHCNKLLLTATPLQNSLLELFGLVSFIDEHTFGDLKSFREQFVNLSQEQVFDTLKARLKPICHRTLRRQVTAYVPFTSRFALVEDFGFITWFPIIFSVPIFRPCRPASARL
jgi:adenine-specific DNA-methyltransferase